MKFLPLIWSGIWRRPLRGLLMLVQIAIAFALFGLLQGMNGALKEAVAKQRADVLYVTSVSKKPLPIAHLEQIESIAGVDIVNPQNYLPGSYQLPSQQVVAIATDPLRYFKINTYCVVPPSELDALIKTRTGVIVGAELVRKFGWKMGDRIPLQSPIPQQDGSHSWFFDVVGVYVYPEEPDMANLLIVNNTYFDEARAGKKGTVSRFVVHVADTKGALKIMDAIDGLFANSPNETRTQSESESSQTRLQAMGDLDFVARTITIAAFFTLLLSVGTIMMHSVRERTPELAILKAVGFSDRLTMYLVAAELTILCGMGAGLGLGLASCLFPYARAYAGAVSMPGTTVVVGFGFAILLAAICGIPPVRHVIRLQVIEALSGR